MLNDFPPIVVSQGPINCLPVSSPPTQNSLLPVNISPLDLFHACQCPPFHNNSLFLVCIHLLNFSTACQYPQFHKNSIFLVCIHLLDLSNTCQYTHQTYFMLVSVLHSTRTVFFLSASTYQTCIMPVNIPPLDLSLLVSIISSTRDLLEISFSCLHLITISIYAACQCTPSRLFFACPFHKKYLLLVCIHLLDLSTACQYTHQTYFMLVSVLHSTRTLFFLSASTYQSSLVPVNISPLDLFHACQYPPFHKNCIFLVCIHLLDLSSACQYTPTRPITCLSVSSNPQDIFLLVGIENQTFLLPVNILSLRLVSILLPVGIHLLDLSNACQ